MDKQKKPIIYYAQGDLLAFPCESIPESARLCEHKVAADGLIRHIVNNGDVYDFNEQRFIAANAGCFISHPEHNSMILDVGFYEIKKVLEYSHFDEESREVID